MRSVTPHTHTYTHTQSICTHNYIYTHTHTCTHTHIQRQQKTLHIRCWTRIPECLELAAHRRQRSCKEELRFLLVGCLMSQKHAKVSQEQICSDNCTCCHSRTEAADQTFYLTQSQYTDIGLTRPSTDSTMPGAWQGSQWSTKFYVTGMTWPG